MRPATSVRISCTCQMAAALQNDIDTDATHRISFMIDLFLLDILQRMLLTIV